MTIAFISHPDFYLHEMGMFHPEQPARLKSIDQAISNFNLDDKLIRYEAPAVTREQLLRVHAADYIDFIFQSSPKQGYNPLDPDTSMNRFTLNAALHAAGAVIMGVDLVMKGDVNAAFCSVRPPGHHAEHDKAMGFCFFNNLAVGVAHALEHYQLKRIAIIDFDVHHGNGTEDIFLNEPKVLFCSSFEYPFYPFSGADTQSNHIINIPLPAGTDGKVFREQVKKLWLDPVLAFQPEMIFFSAGFDAYFKDELADLLFSEDDYLWITKEIKNIADKTCQGKIVSTLEGGYSLEGLGNCVVAHLNGLI